MKESNILANPKLDEWITYMKAFNKKFPKKQTSLVTTLTTHYADDDLARMIQAAKKVPGTAKIAKRLEIEQIYRWLEHQKTPKEVFNLLKLDDVTVEPFLQPQMLTWAKYIDYFDKANPGKRPPCCRLSGIMTKNPWSRCSSKPRRSRPRSTSQ